MIFPGDVIRTSYGTGPFVVEKITEGCSCRAYLDELNCHAHRLGRRREPRRLRKRVPPHYHFTCRDVADGGEAYLNRYVYTPSGRCISLEKCHASAVPEYQPDRHDEIFVVEQAVVQLSLL